MNDATKFVWAYLLENGIETTGAWSYYGSDWESIPGKDYGQQVDSYKSLLDKVKNIGIDWDKTKEPSSGTESCFDGTFVEASSSETLLGTLFLKDGSSYIIGCKDEDNMGSYIGNLMKLMKDKERVARVLGE